MGHLWPVMRNILQILGVSGELTEELPESFDRTELLFGGRLFLVWAHQLVLTQDAADGVVARGQGELVLQALSTEAGLFTQFDDLAFQAVGGLMWAMMRAATEFLE